MSMRIPCSYCGERGHEEFVYLGDATLRRPAAPLPDTGADATGAAAAEAAFADYVYLRDNPSGPHRELWHHAGGCRAWLVVTRDTRTHEILAVAPARDVALERDGHAA
jgi:sarcosine oxidase subunit delta